MSNEERSCEDCTIKKICWKPGKLCNDFSEKINYDDIPGYKIRYHKLTKEQKQKVSDKIMGMSNFVRLTGKGNHIYSSDEICPLCEDRGNLDVTFDGYRWRIRGDKDGESIRFDICYECYFYIFMSVIDPVDI